MKKVLIKWAVFRNGGVGRAVGRNSEPAGRFRLETSGHTERDVSQWLVVVDGDRFTRRGTKRIFFFFKSAVKSVRKILFYDFYH